MPRRSILFVSLMNGSAWGGSEQLWYRTAMHAARAGHDVGCTMYAWEQPREHLDALRTAGARVFEIPNDGHEKRNLTEALRFEVATKLRRRAVLASLPFEAYDCTVLSQGGWQDLAISEWSAVRARLRRYVLLFHNYEDEPSITRRRSARLAAWIAGASANLFAASRIRTVVERKLGVSAPNPGVLLNPIAFTPPEQPIPLPPGPPWRLAVFAALDCSRKAQDVLLRVLAGPQWRGRSYELYLYGSGPDERLLARLATDTGLSEKVRLMGHTNDVLGALSSAHVVLQLTRLDAMPISVMEAMAVGRPVAVTRVGDMPAWVQGGENGWVSADATAESVAATLEAVWGSRDRWEALGARSHRVFRERYAAPAEERLLDELLRLCAHAGPAPRRAPAGG